MKFTSVILLVAIVFFGSVYAKSYYDEQNQPSVDDSLVLYMKMGSALDSSQYKNDGVIYGATIVDGKIGNALSFDGNDKVNCGHASSLDITTQLTITEWIKFTTQLTSYKGLITKINAYQSQVGADGVGKFRIAIYIGGSWKIGPYSNAVLNDGLWHYTVGTYDGINIRTYIDGVEQGTSTAQVGAINTNTNDLSVGVYGIDGSSYFIGTIDEARIYNRALSAAEIRALYLEGSP